MLKQSKTIAVTGQNVKCLCWEPSPTVALNKAVVVAYGSMGMEGSYGQMIERFCGALCEAGYFVVAPDYFSCTATKPGLQAAFAATNVDFDAWVNCLSAATNLARAPATSKPVALVGFSLGGNLVLKAALTFPVDAVVDYFGPITVLSDSGSHQLSQVRVAKMPATQIHHGKRDQLVTLANSQTLQQWLLANGVECDAHLDYDCGHPGDLLAPPWDADAETKSLEKTLLFLKRTL